MKVWMLSQCYPHPTEQGWEWPVADSYSNGHLFHHRPETSEPWALVLCDSTPQQIEAAEQDPRVQPYRTPWDTLTPETVAAYANIGAVQGMMLCQLLSLLAKVEPGYIGVF